MGPQEGRQLNVGSQEEPQSRSRRRLLAAAASVPFLPWGAAIAADFWSQPRRLWIQRRTPLGIEEYRGIYFADGNLIWDEYVKVCRILRDVRAGVAVQMSVPLLDIMCGMLGVAEVEGQVVPYITTSGHRTSWTNASTEGAVRGSLHIEGRAVDGLIPGYSPQAMADRAKYLRGGGVGVYAARGFCHLDDGRIRTWEG